MAGGAMKNDVREQILVKAVVIASGVLTWVFVSPAAAAGTLIVLEAIGLTLLIALTDSIK